MRSACRGIAVFLLALGLVLGADLALNREAAQAAGQKAKDGKKNGKKNGKNKKNGNDEKSIRFALKQMVQARNALGKAIQVELNDRKPEKDVANQLDKALREVDQGINRARKALQINDD